MDLEDLFVPCGLSKEMMKIGFVEPCLFYYFKNGERSKYTSLNHRNSKLSQPYEFSHTAILWEQAFDWFENFGLYSSQNNITLEYHIIHTSEQDCLVYVQEVVLETKEEVKTERLKHLIKLWKKHFK